MTVFRRRLPMEGKVMIRRLHNASIRLWSCPSPNCLRRPAAAVAHERAWETNKKASITQATAICDVMKCLDKRVKPIVCTIDVMIIEIACIHIGGLYILPRIFAFFFRRLISELTKWYLTKIGHMVGSKCCRLNGLHCLLLTPKKSASATVHLVHRRSLTTEVDCTSIC